MGFAFIVGLPADAFIEPTAGVVQQEIEKRFQFNFPPQSPFEEGGYQSEELVWSGWRKLQERAVAQIGQATLPHLLANEAWLAAYLPIDIPPQTISVAGIDRLQIAALPALLKELIAFAESSGLPIEKSDLLDLQNEYLDDGDRLDEDIDIQTYVQAMLCAQVATSNNLPLWLVK